jgi:hypothetical protein
MISVQESVPLSKDITTYLEQALSATNILMLGSAKVDDLRAAILYQRGLEVVGNFRSITSLFTRIAGEVNFLFFFFASGLRFSLGFKMAYLFIFLLGGGSFQCTVARAGCHCESSSSKASTTAFCVFEHYGRTSIRDCWPGI